MSSIFPDSSILIDRGNEIIEPFDCPFEILCALVIVYGESGLEEIFSSPIPIANIEKALAIVKSLGSRGGGLLPSPTDGSALVLSPASSPLSSTLTIDVTRIFRDVKYAQQVQDSIYSEESVENFLSAMLPGNILALSLNASGCRVVQKLLDLAFPDEVLHAIIHPEISSKILSLCMDVNGNHVVQKYIDVVEGKRAGCGFIIDAVVGSGDIIKIASHCYGCRVVQRLMSRCPLEDVSPVLEALCSSPETIAKLSEDVFGNYVMQHAIEHGRTIDRERISLCLASMDILKLGCSKYASNVVEKSIRFHNRPIPNAGESVVVTKLVINSILMSVDPITGEPGILTLMKDKYGNYVVRAVIELSPLEFCLEVSHVKQLIIDNSQMLKKFTFSWHLVERLEKSVPT
jgi:hypothetical protein